MWTSTRRTIVRNLARMPVVAGIAKWSLFGSAIWDEEGLDHDKKFLAVRILRLVNTVQARHFEAYGRFTEFAELGKSEPEAKWLDTEGAEKKKIGRSLFSTLHFDRREIVPEWSFDYKLKDDSSGYAVVLKDTSGDGLGAFSTDERGLIFEGEPVTAPVSELEWRTADLFVSGKPIESVRYNPRKSDSFLRRIAFGPVSILADCCGGCCGCHCESKSIPGCSNCGCLCCTWCCCL